MTTPAKKSSNQDSRRRSAQVQGTEVHKEFLESIYLILDGEASAKETKDFQKHIEKCNSCYQAYRLEKSIRESLQNKIPKKTAPQELIKSIHQEITKLSNNK